MESNITIRQNQLKFFQQFIESSITNFKSILDSIGWTESEIQKEDSLVSCPYDKSHRVSVKNLEQHQTLCSLRRLGYTESDVQLSEPVHNSKSSIKIDKVSKQSIFDHEKRYKNEFLSGLKGEDADPKTSDRLLTTFTSDERLALYNFAVKSTEGPEEPPELNLEQPIEDYKELSREERLEQERNAKRRRIKYKSVHTKRKNHTEVIREVISNQMELYKECITHKQKKPLTMDANELKDVKTANDPNDDNISVHSYGCDDTQSVTSRFSHYSASSTQSKHHHSSKRRSNDFRESGRRRDYSRDHHRSSREKYRSHSRSRTTERRENGCHKSKDGEDRHDHQDSRRKRSEDYKRDTSNSSNGRDYKRVRKSPSKY